MLKFKNIVKERNIYPIESSFNRLEVILREKIPIPIGVENIFLFYTPSSHLLNI